MDTDASPAAAPADPGPGALACDGAGGARPVALAEAAAGLETPAWPWIHLDRTDPTHRRWLTEQSGLDALACDALLEQETRPRLFAHGPGMLVILRGVNLNPGSQPDDMISLRVWIEPGRIITLRHRRLLAVHDVREQLLQGRGPRSPGEVFVAIAGGLVDRQGGVVGALEDGVDGVEEQILTEAAHALRARIAELRRQAIGLRRYIAPQRDVLSRLVQEPVDWLDDRSRARLREVAERQVRLVEEVDAARERASVAQEELNGRLSEQMNRNMYVLSVVAGVFLPLGLLTGLLGINVGGMPGVESPVAFWIVCVLLGVLAGGVIWLFRRKSIL